VGVCVVCVCACVRACLCVYICVQVCMFVQVCALMRLGYPESSSVIVLNLLSMTDSLFFTSKGASNSHGLNSQDG